MFTVRATAHHGVTSTLAQYYATHYPDSTITTQPAPGSYGLAFRNIDTQYSLAVTMGMVHVGLLHTVDGECRVTHVNQFGPLAQYRTDSIAQFGAEQLAVYLVIPADQLDVGAITRRLALLSQHSGPNVRCSLASDYNIITANCEHVSTYLLTGNASSRQVTAGIQAVVGHVQHTIAQTQ